MVVHISDLFGFGWRFSLALLLLSLNGCKKESKPTPSASKSITFATWPGYIAEDVIADFEKETGTNVQLLEFQNVEQLESVLQEDGGTYDVICTYQSIINPFAKLGMFSELNSAWLPSRANILPSISNQLEQAYAKYTVPYFCGHLVLLYNKNHFPDPPDSWGELWNPALRGKVALVNDPGCLFALAHFPEAKRLQFAGVTNAVLASSYDELLEQCGDIANYKPVMEAINEGSCVIGNTYSVCIRDQRDLFPDLGVVIPKEGTSGWIDCLSLSNRSKNLREAHRFIDFLLRPKVAAKNAAALGCVPVVKGALSLIDPSITAERALFPTAKAWRDTPLTPEYSPAFLKRLEPFAIKANKRHHELNPNPRDVIRIASWPEYISPEVLEKFKESTGVTVLVNPFDGISDLENLLQEDLGSHDLFVVDRAYLQSFLDHGYFRQLDKKQLPNLNHVAPSFHELIQPGAADFCVPYFSGTSVIVYNRKHINPPPDSWNNFLDPRYEGKLGLVNYPPDFLALAQIGETGTFAFKEFNDTVQRKARFRKFLDSSGQAGDLLDVLNAIGAGDLWIGNASGGDVYFLQKRFPDLEAIIPKEGVMRWLDCLVISRRAKQPEHAHRFINFLLNPEIAAMNADTTGYDPMISGIREFMEPDLLANPVLFPKTSNDFPLYPEVSLRLRGIMEDYEMDAYSRDANPALKPRPAPQAKGILD